MGALNFAQEPAPYLGQRDSVPLAALQPPYCQWSDNFNHDNGKSYVRNGDGQHGDDPSYATAEIFAYRGGSKLFAPTGISPGATVIADVTTQNAFTSAYAPGGVYTKTFFTVGYFGNYMYIWGDGTFGSGLGGYYYDGTTWGSTPYTLPVGFAPIASVAYKNRNYLVSYQSNVVGYSDVSNYTGTLTTEDFTSIFGSSGYIIGIKNVSLSDNVEAQNFLVLIHSSGEIVAYQGMYPGSPDWQIAGRYQLPSPASSYKAFIDFRGDSNIITSTGLYSCRDLFLKGSQATEDLALSAQNVNRWREIFNVYSASLELKIQGVWDEKNNRLVILFPWQVTRAGVLRFGGVTNPGMFVIYDLTNQRWYEHPTCEYGNGIVGIAYLNGNVYYSDSARGAVMRKESASNHIEAGTSTGVAFRLRSAPQKTQKFGISQARGIEGIIQSDQNTIVNWKLIFNLGATETLPQKVAQQQTVVTIPKYDIGGVGNFIQYEISGTCVSGTVGFNLYATNLWFEDGGPR